MDEPVELLVYEFLAEKIAAEPDGSPVYQGEVHDTVYQKITRPYGVRVGPALSELAPDRGGELKEYDGELTIICFAEIEGSESFERAAALKQVFAIWKKIAEFVLEDVTLGGRVCNTVIRKGLRAYDTEHDDVYAVAFLPIVIDPSS